MKRNNALYAVVSAVTLWGLLFLAGCSNVLITPPQDTKGKVTISVNGGGTAARTLYPDAEFSKYELSFTPKGEQQGHANVFLTDGQTSAVIDLADGEWEVKAVGYVEIWVGKTKQEFAAAEGTQTLHSGDSSLSISISATKDGEDDGYFSWDVTFPPSKVDRASLRFTNYDDVNFETESEFTGQLKVAPGYYLVQVRLENGYQQAGHTEVVHIYSNMETRADYSYTAEDFTDFITLSGKATVTLNGNTPDHAYLGVFSSQDPDNSDLLGEAEIDLSDGSWSIHLLPLDSRTTLYFWIAVEGSEGYFTKYTGETLLVYDEDLKDNDWVIDFSTITLGSNADLQSISINGTALGGFTADTTSYTATVNSDTATVSAVAAHSGADVDYSPSSSIDLNPGETGTITIIVTAEDGTTKKDYTLAITREVILVSSISITPKSKDLLPNGEVQLSALVSPNTATNKGITWETDNASIATVDSSGKVTGISAGQATITATAQDGSGISGQCVVNVKASGKQVNVVDFTGFNDQTIDLSGFTKDTLSQSNWDSLSIGLGDDWDADQYPIWSLDGEIYPYGSYYHYVDAYDLAIGDHTVAVVVYKNGVPYSKELKFRVVK